MKTIITFLQVDAKERIPEKNDINYITIYGPSGLSHNQVITADRKKIWWLAKEQNMFDVYWLEPNCTDVEEDINLNLDDKISLTFDEKTGELIKQH